MTRHRARGVCVTHAGTHVRPFPSHLALPRASLVGMWSIECMLATITWAWGGIGNLGDESWTLVSEGMLEIQ